MLYQEIPGNPPNLGKDRDMQVDLESQLDTMGKKKKKTSVLRLLSKKKEIKRKKPKKKKSCKRKTHKGKVIRISDLSRNPKSKNVCDDLFQLLRMNKTRFTISSNGILFYIF